ncbi:MAG: bile acid:sodium symporter family protein [Ignavibacterium sp.]|nr:MAG: bile acid:sodium symporter family protein [Ignavibacterium sp.]
MNKRNLSRGFLAFALISFILFGVFYFSGQIGWTGPWLILAFIGLAIAVRGFPLLKGFSFSLWIFTAVSVSMYYPKYFLGIGDFNYKLLIVPLLQIIMFGMGSQMSIRDFAGVIKMPKGVIAGIICQFTIMPVVGFTVATLINFPPEIAAGIILVGSSPSGLASNVMSFIAKANLALSVTLTACATLLSPILTPFLMKVFAGQLVEIDFFNMMLGIFNMVILPICAGLVFNIFSYGNVSRNSGVAQMIAYFLIIILKNVIALQTSAIAGLEFAISLLTDTGFFMVLPIAGAFIFKFFAKGNKDVLDKTLSLVSMLGIGIIITIITAAGRDSLLDVGLLLILACFLHNAFGYILGYSVSKLLKMDEQDCRTIALEVGMQNGGMASGLALQMGKVATVGLAPAIFGPMMNITGSSLATWWRGNPPNRRKES